MKPENANVHQSIAQWVKNGGTLVYCGRDNDPFQTVQEWWNTQNMHYSSPSAHLFELLEMNKNPKDGIYTFGKGSVFVLRNDPKEFVLKAQNDSRFIELVKQAYE